MDFMVVEEHPTLLNVTLHPSKVGVGVQWSRRPWQPPWLAIPRYRSFIVEVMGSAGERGDHPYAYYPLEHSNISWKEGLSGSRCTNIDLILYTFVMYIAFS